MGRRKLLVYVRIVITAIFDFMTEEDYIGRIKIVTLRVGANLKHFHLSSGVSTWRFREQKHWRARRKRLHSRL